MSRDFFIVRIYTFNYYARNIGRVHIFMECTLLINCVTQLIGGTQQSGSFISLPQLLSKVED